MKITDEAKTLITETLVSNNCDCLQVTLQKSCCGTSLNFAIGNLNANDKPFSINGISVIMDSQVQSRTDKVTLAAKNGELIVEGDAPSCCC